MTIFITLDTIFMKYILVFFCFHFSNALLAQQFFPTFEKKPGDSTAYHIQLNEATVVDSRIFLNDTTRYRYNQLKYLIKTVLPYVNNAVKLFNDIDLTTRNMDKKSKRKYIKSKEKEINLKFESKLKQLNITQGKLLVKLIHRQLSINIYDILKELKNPISAAYYQAWARVNGINLNEDYNPNNEKDIETIMTKLGY